MGAAMTEDDAATAIEAVKLIVRLITALEESVRLQSHYAGILNGYDGGSRLQFADADEWIARLISTGTLAQSSNPKR